MNNHEPKPETTATAERRSWIAPRVQDLPRLTELTLATGGAIPGGGGTGGTTVF